MTAKLIGQIVPNTVILNHFFIQQPSSDACSDEVVDKNVLIVASQIIFERERPARPACLSKDWAVTRSILHGKV